MHCRNSLEILHAFTLWIRHNLWKRQQKKNSKGATKKSNAKEPENKEHKKKQLPYEWRRINDFFEWFEVSVATEHFWEILKLAITYEGEGPDGRERSNMIFFFEYTRELYENIYNLLQKEK